jgi:hypothetical protein
MDMLWVWEGEPIQDLSREKLLEVIEYLAPFEKRAHEAEKNLSILRVNTSAEKARAFIHNQRLM